MELTANNILATITANTLTWRHVDDLPCVHTFFKNYYINLCSYKFENKPVISINVDDVQNNINDIIDVFYDEGSLEFQSLKPIYDKALCEGVQIPSTSFA